MANPEHLDWLAEGVTSWNARREQDTFIPDLEGEDISGRLGILDREYARGIRADLRSINLSGADLTGSTLRSTDLSSALIGNAKLDRANLSRSCFDGARFAGAQLREADLSSGSLANARLLSTNFSGAKLLGTDVKGAQFFGCTLNDAHLYSADIIGADFIRSRPWQANLHWSLWNTYLEPAHLDVCNINGIASLVEVCRQLQNAYGNNVVLYYRGESKSFNELRPSVMRNPKKGQLPLRPVESEMLNDLLTRQPDAFHGLNSALGQWVMAQHHLLKTRMLDITRNPQVGLFFACDNDEGKDGQLHIFAVPKQLIKPFHSDAVTVIANFAKLPRAEQNMLLGKFEGDVVDDVYPDRANVMPGGIELYNQAKSHFYSIIRRDRPDFQERIDIRDFFRVLVVEPQQMFERIRAQSGAFLISAFHERFERTEILRHDSHTPIYAHHVLRVPHAAKESILNDLRVVNVSNEYLFPGVDQTAKAITEQYRSRST